MNSWGNSLDRGLFPEIIIFLWVFSSYHILAQVHIPRARTTGTIIWPSALKAVCAHWCAWCLESPPDLCPGRQYFVSMEAMSPFQGLDLWKENTDTEGLPRPNNSESTLTFQKCSWSPHDFTPGVPMVKPVQELFTSCWLNIYLHSLQT